MHLLLAASLLLGLHPTAPIRDSLQDSEASSQDGQGQGEPQNQQEPEQHSAWHKLSRLVGGEWNAVGEGVPARFHRFWFGPGENSIWTHTRDATKLEVWPQSESIYYWHPGEGVLKTIAVAPNTLFSGTLTWDKDRLEKDFVYQVGSQSFDFLSQWAFDGDQAYDWKLFRKTDKGRASQGGMRFEHSSELRPLPEIAPPQLKPIEQLAFLAPLLGPWDVLPVDSEGEGEHQRVIYSWAAGGSAMLIETMQAGDDGRPTAKGMAYWHPDSKEVRYVEALAQGEVREGKIATAENEAGESTILFALQSWSQDSTHMFKASWTPKEGLVAGRLATMLPGEDPRYQSLQLKRPQ